MRQLVKKLDNPTRLAASLLKRAPSFEVRHSQLADGLEVALSDGSQAQLALPHHTHLAVGDVLIDSMGMMVRVTGAQQDVLMVEEPDAARMAQLAFALGKSGFAVALDGTRVLTEPLHELEHWLRDNGYAAAAAQGRLDPPALRAPVRSHAHDHAEEPAKVHAHGHDHDHGHDHPHEHADDHGHSHGHDHDHDHGHKH